MQKALLTVREAAVELFGEFNETTRKRVYRMIEVEMIKSVRSGSRHYIRSVDLEPLKERVG
jgi:DNA-binding transcriptional regulator YhcF (GntR family)